MGEWILEKGDLHPLLGLWNKSRKVLVPAKNGRVSRFEPYGPDPRFSPDFPDTRIPPKEVFLPNGQVLFGYGPGGEVSVPGGKDEMPSVLVGVRPCDARAVAVIDSVLRNSGFRDELYVEKREACAMVGIACTHPRSTCFCTSVGGDPFGEEGLDAILVNLGDRYYLKSLSSRGDDLVSESGGLLRECKPEDLETVARLAQNARGSMKVLPVEVMEQELKDMFDHDYWSTLHETCVGCGICTYLCPTCYCFDITDEGYPEGCRVRVWDSCQFPSFTVHTSGHNPRPTGLERWRQRLMHKFNYFVENFGVTGCVGCGRCIVNCPVNLDIRKVIEEIGGMGIEVGVRA